MAITPARQRNAVSQGAALGLLLRGCTELSSDKFKVDLAFEGAWRNWEYRDRFPQVNTDVAKGLDGSIALTRVDGSKKVVGVRWANEGYRHVITTVDADWSVDSPDDVEYALKMIDGDVPIEGWITLADDLLRRLDR